MVTDDEQKTDRSERVLDAEVVVRRRPSKQTVRNHRLEDVGPESTRTQITVDDGPKSWLNTSESADHVVKSLNTFRADDKQKKAIWSNSQ
jgi:hypothetical protein